MAYAYLPYTFSSAAAAVAHIAAEYDLCFIDFS
jgi:hypothetical protein